MAQMKMRALVKKYPKPGIWMEEADIPEPGPNDVLIRIMKTSICGTDIHIYQWNEWAQKTIPVPMIIGHEYIGEVVGFGANVSDVKLGERVSGEGHLTCGVCRNCLAGRRHLCHNTSGVGVNRPGAFAEYLVIPVTNIWHCDESISDELYACFDPFGNAVHTALSFDVTGEDVLVTGAGPIGIMAAAVAQKVGARHVVITDPNPYRLELARSLGIIHAYNPAVTSIKEIQRELNMKEGFDVGMEMSGNAAAFSDMINNMSHGGKIAVLGLQSSNTEVDWNTIVMNGLTLKGIYGREMYETWYKMTMLLQSGLTLQPIITHRFPADRFGEGFEMMASGNSGKIILDWSI